MRRTHVPHKRGFSLIELVVVLAIIGILAGLLMAAVQRARESASRTECANHLRQLGLAMHMHHDTYKVFPSNGGWDGKQKIQAVDGSWTYVYTEDPVVNQIMYWGVGQPGVSPQDQTGSWAYAILPFLEQEAVYRRRTWTLPLDIYVCPSRRLPEAKVPINDAYGRYQGGGWAWGHIDYAGNAYIVPNRPQCLRIADITDGTSQTILVGEKAMNPIDYNTGTWYWDEPFFLGGSGGTQRGRGYSTADGTSILWDDIGMYFSYRYNWGSAHPGGAQFVFADGSLHILPYGMPPAGVLALLSPNAGDLVPDY